MQTIQLQVDDDLYQDIKDSGIDIQNILKDFLYKLNDDSYPTITTEEAKNRISIAVEEYRNGTMQTVSHDDMWDSIDSQCTEKIANKV